MPKRRVLLSTVLTLKVELPSSATVTVLSLLTFIEFGVPSGFIAIVTGNGFTFTSLVSEAELPNRSVAVQVPVVSPSGNTYGASLFTTGFVSR